MIYQADGNVFTESASNQKISGLRGCAIKNLNSVLPRNCMISFDGKSQRFLLLPNATIFYPIENFITIHFENATLTSAIASINTNVSFKFYVYEEHEICHITDFNSVLVDTLNFNFATGVEALQFIDYKECLISITQNTSDSSLNSQIELALQNVRNGTNFSSAKRSIFLATNNSTDANFVKINNVYDKLEFTKTNQLTKANYINVRFTL